MSYGNIYYDRKKSKVYWSEYEGGVKKERCKDWVPDFWLQTPDQSDFVSEKGNNLKRIVAETWGERNALIKKYKVNSEIENSVEVCGSDLSPEVKFILETWPQDLTETPNIWTMFVDIECECEFGFPEAEEAKERINLITVYSTKTYSYTTFALRTDYSCNIKFEDKNIDYRFCDTEEELLINFIEFLDEERFEIFSGWHSGGFDIPYLINRTIRILDNVDLDRYNFILTDTKTKEEERKLVDESSKLWDELGEEIKAYAKEIKEIRKDLKWTKRFSPYRIVEKKIKMEKDRFTKELKPTMVYNIEGVTDYDYLELDRQFRQGKRDSYKLDNVAKDELGDEKIPHEGSMKDFYRNEWTKFVNYNIKDVTLVVGLNKKLNYIPQAVALSYKCHCQFEDNFGTVQKIESAIYNFLYKEKIIMSDHSMRHGSEEKIPGAYVTPAGSLRRGFHHWIIDYDATSLYPSLMRGINISHDTKIGNIKATKHILKVDDDEQVSVLFVGGGIKKMKAFQLKQFIKEKGYHVASNNVIFENLEIKKGVLVKMLDMWFSQRKADKKIHDKYRGEAVAIFENCQEVENGHSVLDDGKIKKLSEEDFKKYSETMRLSGIHYNLQWACKILLNSVYGCLASRFFRYYDRDLGMAVTTSGQTVIKNIGNRLNNFFNEDIFNKNIVKKHFQINHEIKKTETLLFQDTDSNFLTFNELLNKLNVKQEDKERLKVTKFLAVLAGKELEQFTDKFFFETFNAKNTIFWSQELVARTGIWCQPKKYVCFILEEKGKPPENTMLKKGIDLVRSSIPRKFKTGITEVVDMMLRGSDQDKINEVILQMYKDSKTWTIEEISIPCSCNNLSKFSNISDLNFISGTPQHMKGAVAYNYYLKKRKLTQYEPIKEKDKFSLLFLAKNTKYSISTIGFKDKLPKELCIEQLVDRDQHFMRGCIKPLSLIFDAVKWNFPETKNASINTDDLFS